RPFETASSASLILPKIKASLAWALLFWFLPYVFQHFALRDSYAGNTPSRSWRSNHIEHHKIFSI
ncbi:hypothetical protein, partial [Paenibacillus ferrarius]|uniref:hypothetical protein n=1 Tax=Paenibacillus ferrarius TaxID=1469647 RepID=UPI003D284A43